MTGESEDIENLTFQLVNQRNIEYTLYHFFRLRAENERDPIAKVVYRKLRNDSRVHMIILEDAIRALGKKVPKRIMLEVINFDVDTMERREALMEDVEDALEDLEACLLYTSPSPRD